MNLQFMKYRSLKPLMEIGKLIRQIVLKLKEAPKMHKNHGFCCRSMLNEISQITVCVIFIFDQYHLKVRHFTYIFNDCNLLSGETSLLLKRFRHSITPTRPKMPTWRRKVMVEFAKPVFSEKHPTTEFLWQECPRIEEDLKSQKVQCSI